MPGKVVIFASVTAKPELIDEVLAALNLLTEESRKEDGCLNYDLHRGVDDPNLFVLHETWLSAEHVLAHNQTSHFKEAVRFLEQSAVSTVVNRTSML